MITAQDIREKAFEKNRKVGYDMEAVDVFLEEVADSITAYQKENSVLKSKMKVLVDKIEEYRGNEEALNRALLSAQKLASQIESDARTRAAAMIAEAEEKVKETLGGIDELREAEEKKLAEAKTATDSFFDKVRSLCSAQLKTLDEIGFGTRSEEEPEDEYEDVDEAVEEDVDDAVRSIEETVSRLQPEPAVKFDLASAMKAPPKAKSSFDNTQQFTL